MRLLLAMAALLLLPASILAQTLAGGSDNAAPPISVNGGPNHNPSPHPLAGLPSTQYALNLKGVLPNYGLPIKADGTYTPLNDGLYSAQFRLYEVSDRNNPAPPVYQETQNVAVFTTPALVAGQADRKGKYAVTLGNQSANPLYASQFTNKTLWMEVWINGQQPPSSVLRQQILQIPADSTVAKSMNEIIWVTNALNSIETNHAIETAALAFYVQKVYAAIPGADPNFVLRSLIRAESAFSQRYRSPQTGDFRVATNPLDAVVNMYGALINQPGNPVTLSLINESLNFAAGSLDLSNGGQNKGQSPYQQFSYELGRMTATASFNDYTSTQLEGLYLLARQNHAAAQVVNTFFGHRYKAKTSDSLFTILNSNPSLLNSMNFAPLYTQIEADGTLLATLDTALANVADFYDRMTTATNIMNTALAAMTAAQKSDFVGTPNNQNTAAAVINAFNVADTPVKTILMAADPSTYVTKQIILTSHRAYDNLSKIQAGLTLAAAVTTTCADVAYAIADQLRLFSEPKATGNGLKIGADIITTGAATIGFALQFVRSPNDTIEDGLMQISAQIAGVAAQLNARLNIIDGNQLTFFNQMNTNFHNLSNAITLGLSTIGMRIDDLVNNVAAVQYSLDRLTQDFSAFANQSSRAALLVPYLTEINNWSSNPAAMRAQATMDYGAVFSRCQTYATSTSLASALENGNLSMDGFASSYGDTAVVAQLDPISEKNLNYLLAFAYHRFYLRENTADYIFRSPVSDPSLLHNLGVSLANSTAWEMSSLGMMRAATIYPDLGLNYIQNTTAFSAAYSIGNNLQNAATSITLQYQSGSNNTVIQTSPILTDMMYHQRLMAQNLYSAIVAAENGATTTAAQVANVQTALNNTNSAVSLAVKALDGSHRLLEQFIEFGLSRSVKSDMVISSLLYSAGDAAFRDPLGNLASDPNAQKLPDGNWVTSLYHNWVASQPSGPYTYVTGDPAAIFLAAQRERWNVMEQELDGNLWSADSSTLLGHAATSILDRLARDANTNGLLLGEPLANVDAIQSRLSYFLIPTVSGTISPAGLPNLKPNQQPKSLANTAITLTFRGSGSVFTAPVLLDASSHFTVYVPKAQYTVLASAPGFLQGTVVAPGQALIDTTSSDSGVMNAIHNVVVSSVYGSVTTNGLIVGDITGDNLIDNSDLIFLRNAFGSVQSSPNWIAKYDLNGDGIVNYKDLILLQGALYSTTADRAYNVLCDLNNDGKVDGADQAIFGAALGSLKSDPAKGGLPSMNWNPACDFNGDGAVDYKDQEILQGKVGTNPASVNWNPLFDLNGDGKIDAYNAHGVGAPTAADLKTDGWLLFAGLGSRASSVNWNPLADLNGDGVVDANDLLMLRANFGRPGKN